MPARMIAMVFLAVSLLVGAAAPRALSADYKVDPAHTAVTFAIEHAGISTVFGRFNKVDGSVTVDESDPTKNAFQITIDAASVDTGVERRDNHLRTADFFDVEQFPTITFTSTQVEPAGDVWNVTGDLAMHGVTKSITIPVKFGGATEMPPNTPRVGLTAEFTVNRKDFGVGLPKFDGMIGEQVQLRIGLEAINPPAEPAE